MIGRQMMLMHFIQIFRNHKIIGNYSSLVGIYIFWKVTISKFLHKTPILASYGKILESKITERHLETEASHLAEMCSFSCRMLATFIRRYCASFTRESEMFVAEDRPKKKKSIQDSKMIIKISNFTPSFLWSLTHSHY